MADQVSEEQQNKLKIDGSETDSEETDLKINPFDSNPDPGEESVADAGEEEEIADFEFSFPSIKDASSPISADDIFHTGKIRPMLPFLGWSVPDDGTAPEPSKVEPFRKFFAADETEGTVKEIKSASGLGRKSNSTGSSRLRRFRDLVHRSSSDGKNAFVFLNPDTGSSVKASEKKAKKKNKDKSSALAVPEQHTLYGKNKASAENCRSYLQYRPGLIGFSTNDNGLSKNVHSF